MQTHTELYDLSTPALTMADIHTKEDEGWAVGQVLYMKNFGPQLLVVFQREILYTFPAGAPT